MIDSKYRLIGMEHEYPTDLDPDAAIRYRKVRIKSTDAPKASGGSQPAWYAFLHRQFPGGLMTHGTYKIFSNAFRTLLIPVLVVAAATGCTRNSSPISITGDTTSIRPLTETEALADYDAMIASIQSLYGPLEYKERRFGFNFANEAQKIRAKFSSAKTDFEKQSLFFALLRKLEDGHVSLLQPIRERYDIPIVLMPVEGKFLASTVATSLAPYGIEVGDEIIAIDGVTPETGLKTILQYTWFANSESDRHLIYYFTYRPSFIPELQPKHSFAQIDFEKPDGTKRVARIAWKKTSPQERVEAAPKSENERSVLKSGLTDANSMLSEVLEERLNTIANLTQTGSAAPWYWNVKLKRKYGVTMLTPERGRVQNFYPLWAKELDPFEPKPDALKPMPETLPFVWAAMYKYNGKTVLMMRQPSYSVTNAALQLAVYSALIEQFQPIADVLILDQTHNPGGSVTYSEGFARLFAPAGMNGFVQFLNTDRSWFTRLMSAWTKLESGTAGSSIGARLLSVAKDLERDSEAGLRLTQDPFSFSLREVSPPAPIATWHKPVLTLIDELCASGGDAVPMMLKANGLATLFGNRTAGMGGNVEPVLDLPFSRASLRLTRGLFTTFRPDGKYSDADFIENNGVEPDIEYQHTIKDVRNGFDAYFQAFSDVATQ